MTYYNRRQQKFGYNSTYDRAKDLLLWEGTLPGDHQKDISLEIRRYDAGRVKLALYRPDPQSPSIAYTKLGRMALSEVIALHNALGEVIEKMKEGEAQRKQATVTEPKDEPDSEEPDSEELEAAEQILDKASTPPKKRRLSMLGRVA